MQPIPGFIQNLFPSAWIHGKRITRMEEDRIGTFEFDALTAFELGTNNIGLFVGGCRSFDDITRRLRRLESAEVRRTWVVVTCSKTEAVTICRQWSGEEDLSVRDIQSGTEFYRPQRHGNIIVAIPEKLHQIGSDNCNEVAGILVIDENCLIYQARGGVHQGNYWRNDRPQRVANFRNRLTVDGWTPPLFVLTKKPAKSVITHSVQRAYCLDGFWFIEGSSFSCGKREISETPSLSHEQQIQ